MKKGKKTNENMVMMMITMLLGTIIVCNWKIVFCVSKRKKNQTRVIKQEQTTLHSCFQM